MLPKVDVFDAYGTLFDVHPRSAGMRCKSGLIFLDSQKCGGASNLSILGFGLCWGDIWTLPD